MTSVTNGINKHSNTTNTLNLASLTHPAPVAPASPPSSQTMVVTPELAEQWLKANTLNRPVRKSRVKAYARDIQNGRWRFNTQGISFGTDGSLIDGQHRLMAVVEAMTPATFVVWWNVPLATREVIDIGGVRNLGDIEKITTYQAAVCNAVMRGMTTRPVASTMAERGAFYRRYANQINGVIGLFPSKRLSITQASVLGAIVRASFHLSWTDIERFCSVLYTGIGDPNTRDTSVIKLRDRLLMAGTGVGGASQADFYSMTAAALRAFAEGRAVSKIFVISVDPFPLPAIQPGE
jgi:hypothetical protein